MLVEFTVSNFRSFKEPVTFSMLAAPITAKDKEIDANNVFEVDSDLHLLKTAAVYGANASGKSNLAKALAFMRTFVLNSSRESQSTDPIDVEPFLLSTTMEERPSSFEIVFMLDGKRFRYGFEVTHARVVAEWLYRTPGSREATLFKRDSQGVKLGSGFKEGRDIEERTRENALFLSVVAQFNGSVARQVLSWFGNLAIRLGIQDVADRATTLRHLAGEEFKEEIRRFVQQLDLGVADLQLEQKAERILAPLPTVSESLPPDTSVGLSVGFMEELRQFNETLLKYPRMEAHTVHRVYDEQGQPAGNQKFALDKHESEGTKKLFGLAGTIVPALARGTVVIVDELDARLHPLITCAILDLFHNPETNPNNAQLIFTTHDTNLLQHTIFRRDQIWFVEKDRYGVSHLYSLAEFKVRNDASFEKNYIEGRYGAIPFVGDLSGVFEHTDA